MLNVLVHGNIDKASLFVSIKFNIILPVKPTLYFWQSCISHLDKERIILLSDYVDVFIKRKNVKSKVTKLVK